MPHAGQDTSLADQRALHQQSNSISQSIFKRFRRLQNWIVAFKLLVLLGGVLAAIGGVMPAPSDVDGTPWKPILAIGGGVLSLVSGVALILLGHDDVSDLEKARRALDDAQRFLSEKKQIADRLNQFQKLDARRRSLIASLNAMRETVEGFLDTAPSDAKEAFDTFLDTSTRPLLAAMNFDAGERYAFTIYQRSTADDSGRLICISDRRADRKEEQHPTRSWAIGEGWAGLCWQRERTFAIEDTGHAEAQIALHVTEPNRREDDTKRYRSIAAAPILVGHPLDVWGVLVVTSNKRNRFASTSRTSGRQNLDAVDAMAGMLSLIARFKPWDQSSNGATHDARPELV